MSEKYTVKTLAEIADFFETLAADQEASKRRQSNKCAQAECDMKAAIWRDAAGILRKTEIVA